MPLVSRSCSSESARAELARLAPRELFPAAFAPEAAMSGLWLYFSCADECHELCQSLGTAEGSYWHAILHRQEPDAANSGYWFRRVGEHPVFPALLEAARKIAEKSPDARWNPGTRWDPFRFIDYCEEARRQPDSPAYTAACEIQLAEWQLLFDYCARPRA